VATLVDVTGIVIYFHVALWVLGGSLLAPPPPGIVRLDHKPTADAVETLLGLTADWEVESVRLDTKRDVLHILVRETAHFARGVPCSKCNGTLEVYNHADPKVWSYPEIFGHAVEIECSLPLVRCKSCGREPESFPLKIPWEDKGKLLDRPRADRVPAPVRRGVTFNRLALSG
jgi:hypothetical protein